MVKERIGVLGLGLIGGSIALKLKDAFDVVGVDSDAATRAYAATLGLRTETSQTAFVGCSTVFVCVPVSHTVDCILNVYKAVGDSAVISDVASVKGILGDLHLPRLVGGHPMAGTEHSGIRAAKAHLFENANYPLIPYDATEADVTNVERIVRLLGARPMRMTADAHDRYVAEVSHMPHVLAYALSALPDAALGMAGTGFYDMTRIARSDPSFWAQILSANRDNVLAAIDGVTERIAQIRSALEGSENERLTALLKVGQNNRLKLEEDKLCSDEYLLYVDILDRLGAVKDVSAVLTAAGINVKSLSIVHSREGVGGALRLGFAARADRDRAERLLTDQRKENL